MSTNHMPLGLDGDLDKSNPDKPSSQSLEDDAHSDSSEEDDIDRYWPPPTQNSLELAGSYSPKTISALAFNNSGSRLAVGNYDREVKIWDFGVLGIGRLGPISTTQPCGQTVVKNLDYSADDEMCLVIPSSCQATIVGKDGLVLKQYECPKGDQYIVDMNNTKGHVQMLNDGCWNPKDKKTFITCSNDATVRIWDITNLKQQKNVIKMRSPNSGQKTLPTNCRFTRDSLSLVVGCNDGSIQFWDTRRKFISTSSCIKEAHLKGSEITGMDFSYGMNKFCSRSEDEFCKLWDLRKLTKPLGITGGLTTSYPLTDCVFSPDDKYIMTGTSCTKDKSGSLLFLKTDTNHEKLDSVLALTTEKTSVIRTRWHPKINHLAYSCSNGVVHLSYDNRRSLGGVVDQQLSKSKRKRYIDERDQSFIASQNIKIITPHSLPLFRDQAPNSRTKRSYKPEMAPSSDIQNRIKPAGSTLSSYIARGIAKPRDESGTDIRERILQHAEADSISVKPREEDSDLDDQRVKRAKTNFNNGRE